VTTDVEPEIQRLRNSSAPIQQPPPQRSLDAILLLIYISISNILKSCAPFQCQPVKKRGRGPRTNSNDRHSTSTLLHANQLSNILPCFQPCILDEEILRWRCRWMSFRCRFIRCCDI